MKKFWKFKNLLSGTAELLLYGEIASEHSWWDDGGSVYADEFAQELQDLGNVSQITVRINSVGGDVFAAIAIYTQLKMHSARVVCVVDGLAASAATLVLMAADEIQMPDGAIIMIHDPMAVLMGTYNADDLASQVATLETIKQSIISIYAGRTGMGEDDLSEMMAGETWMMADEAIENGFADIKIDEDIETEINMKERKLYMNKIEHDLSVYQTMPELEHARNIQTAIAGAGKGKTFISKFVALAKNAVKKGGAQAGDDEDEPEDPEGDQEDDSADDAGKKSKAKNQAATIFKDEAAGAVDKDAHARNVAAIKNMYPNLIASIIEDARTEERQRIQDIDALAGQISPELVQDAKYTNIQTAMELSYNSMKNSTAKGAAYLSSRAAAAQTSGVRNVGAAPAEMNDQTEEQQRAEVGDMIAGFANKRLGKTSLRREK